MLPVRLLRAPTAAGADTGARRRRVAARRAARPAARVGASGGSSTRQGTILRGERTGATLRLGDPIEVRVARVDASAGASI